MCEFCPIQVCEVCGSEICIYCGNCPSDGHEFDCTFVADEE